MTLLASAFSSVQARIANTLQWFPRLKSPNRSASKHKLSGALERAKNKPNFLREKQANLESIEGMQSCHTFCEKVSKVPVPLEAEDAKCKVEFVPAAWHTECQMHFYGWTRLLGSLNMVLYSTKGCYLFKGPTGHHIHPSSILDYSQREAFQKKALRLAENAF